MWTLKEPGPEEHPTKDFCWGRVFYESVVCTRGSEKSIRYAVPAVPPQPQGLTVWTKHFPCPHETGCTPRQTLKTKQKEAFPDPAHRTLRGPSASH